MYRIELKMKDGSVRYAGENHTTTFEHADIIPNEKAANLLVDIWSESIKRWNGCFMGVVSAQKVKIEKKTVTVRYRIYVFKCEKNIQSFVVDDASCTVDIQGIDKNGQSWGYSAPAIDLEKWATARGFKVWEIFKEEIITLE